MKKQILPTDLDFYPIDLLVYLNTLEVDGVILKKQYGFQHSGNIIEMSLSEFIEEKRVIKSFIPKTFKDSLYSDRYYRIEMCNYIKNKFENKYLRINTTK